MQTFALRNPINLKTLSVIRHGSLLIVDGVSKDYKKQDKAWDRMFVLLASGASKGFTEIIEGSAIISALIGTHDHELGKRIKTALKV
jgi:hypothetical protein